MALVTTNDQHYGDIADSIRAKLGVQTTYLPSEMSAAIDSISGGGGGGIPLLQQSAWDALTIAQKRSYGLVAIQDSSTGFNRGLLVNGADYALCDVFNTGWAASSASFTITDAGEYDLYVIAMNSEASTKSLDTSATQNDTALGVETIANHSYVSSGTDRRNYRISRFAITAQANDTIAISLTNKGNYASMVYALVRSTFNTLAKSLTTPDAATTGTNTADAMVIYGKFNSSNSGEIHVARYDAGDTITTGNPGTSYRSSYIFWFEDAAPQ